MRALIPIVLFSTASLARAQPMEPRPYMFLWSTPSGAIDTTYASQIVVSTWCDPASESAADIGHDVRDKAIAPDSEMRS